MAHTCYLTGRKDAVNILAQPQIKMTIVDPLRGYNAACTMELFEVCLIINPRNIFSNTSGRHTHPHIHRLNCTNSSRLSKKAALTVTDTWFLMA